MSYKLSAKDKISVINQHLRNLWFTRYNYEIGLLEASVADKKEPKQIDSDKIKIEEIDRKCKVLEDELEKLKKIEESESDEEEDESSNG